MQDDPRERELAWLRRLTEVLGRLAQEKDPLRLMPLLLDTAIELTSAERGFLVRVLSPGSLRVEVARGFDKESLRGDAGQVSRTVVNRVLERKGPLLSSGPDEDVREVTSVIQRRVLAILCVPLRVAGEVRAVIYLDHRHRPGAFGLEHVTVAQAFADQAALALDAALARRSTGAPAAPRDVDALLEAPWPPEVPTWGSLVGGSPAFQELVRAVEALPPRAHLLLLGEPGSGRRALARELHARAGEGELVHVACAGLDPAAQRSELLGARSRRGALLAAGEGTLVIADVDRLEGEALDALLLALEEGKVRAGAGRDRPVECRIVATASRPPGPRLLAAGLAQVRVPPLRERIEDVLPLLREHLRRLRRPEPVVSRDAREALLRCAWPGNVAQLEQEALQLAGLGLSELERRHLSPGVTDSGVGGAGPLAGKTLAEIEREALATALREAGGNRAMAARQLGIPKSTLYYLLDRHDLREASKG